MTADIELLPLPAEDYVDDEGLWEKRYGPYSHEQMEGYARANVAHATAPLQAEIEALRVRADAMAGEAIKHEARAERLAEALRESRDSGGYVHDVARAALRDHDQEVGNG